LVRRENGQTLVWNGIDVYPGPDPREYARRKARIFSLSPRTLIFVPSIGLGYGLEELLSRLAPDCCILCVEAHQSVMALAIGEGLPQDPRLIMLRADDEEIVARAIAEMGDLRYRRVVEVPLCAGYRLAPEVYARMRRTLEEQVREYWRNRLTLIGLGSLQVRNLFSNIASFPEAGDFASLSTSMPVVVAGAGPSLEEALPAVRAVRRDVLLVAVDTALPRLSAESMLPDIVIALEAQTANLRDFLPSPRAGTVLLACDLSSHPSAVRLFGVHARFFSSEFAPLHLFARMASAGILPCPFPALGSVGVAAVNAALRLTSGEVFLTGLDLSYPRSITHASGTPYHLAALSETTRLSGPDGPSFRAMAARKKTVVADKQGEPVLTDAVLMSYRESLRRLVSSAGQRVADAGSTGLDLGAARITERELKERVRGAASRCAHLEGSKDPLCSRDSARSFIKAEEAILRHGAILLRDALQSRSPSQECLQFLEDADYSWVHFPDAPNKAETGRSFLARVNAAVRYYAERLAKLESLL
ncbi:MAG TPA: 6-hydroxymethylpterin diphosphokinase MptE-like protein, partial [Spirochaetia bacterium]|nr:6-hydroxymethylpterin diphosphokinase MptE-like protein [Spirochaetia bacterium]